MLFIIYLGWIFITDICNVIFPFRFLGRSQMAERLGNRDINQQVAGLVSGCAKLCCVLGQGRGNVPVLTVCRSG